MEDAVDIRCCRSESQLMQESGSCSLASCSEEPQCDHPRSIVKMFGKSVGRQKASHYRHYLDEGRQFLLFLRW